jgi:hypothetical protein
MKFLLSTFVLLMIIQVILGGDSAHFKTMMKKARSNPMSVSPRAMKMEKHVLNRLSVMTGKTQDRNLDFSDDSDCQDAMCSFLDTMVDCPDSFMGDDDDSMTMSGDMMSCFYTCVGIGGGCSEMTLSSSCITTLSAIFGETVDDAYCLDIFSGDDDSSSDDDTSSGSTTSNSTDDSAGGDDSMSMDDDSMSMDDDMSMDVSMICEDECTYDLYGSVMNLYFTCGSLFSLDDSADDSSSDISMNEAFMNQLCATNSDGDYCMDLFDGMEMDDDEATTSSDDDNMCGVIDAMSSSDSDAMCAEMDDWGCCTSVFLSLGMPTCVSTFMTGTCEMAESMLSTPCTDGTQEDVSIVSVSMAVDQAIDLDNATESASMKVTIAAACSANTGDVTSDQITIIGYTSTSRRMMNMVMGFLRGDAERRLASTEIDFTVTVIGDDSSTDASDIVTQVDSAAFTQTFSDSGMTSTVSSSGSETYEAVPPTFPDDDGAFFLPTFSSSMVVGMVMLSIFLF